MSTSDLRWHVKKAARSGASNLAGIIGTRSTSPAVRVLTYHAIGDAPRDPFCLGRREFAEQMTYLAEQDLALSLTDLEDFLDGHHEAKRGAVVVTLDDGLRSLHSDALPILRDLDIPAVAFVTPGLLDSGAHPATPSDAYLSWKELEEIRAAGVEVGSHGMSHRSLGALSAAAAAEEIFQSREILEQRLGCKIRSMAYPFGTRADYSAETRSSLAAAGYLFGFTSQHGALQPGSDSLELSRVKVERGDSMGLFRRLTVGGMDSWRFVDALLWRLQARP